MMLQEDFVEECWFIYGLRLGTVYLGFLKYHSKGTSGSVDFDWHKALAPLFIGWYHSHPGQKFLTPSDRDNRTMKSWIIGMFEPRLCGIFCDGEQRCYCYYKGAESTKRETIIRRVPIVAHLRGSLFCGTYQKNGVSEKL